ncbi:MAG: hotdog fold thioesterase [Bacteroidales bacterium]|nr:hotdog fold thioesterase [Bacteroidales bacterium]MCF8457986.1 hotdog fold thioesterase [Bacteroidales bacterium]
MIDKHIDTHRMNKICKNSFVSHLGILFFSEKDELMAKMPVSPNHLQPFGILHGGASLALAETIGSAYSLVLLDDDKYSVVGMNMQANHVGSISEGFVIARCKPIHIGKKTHVIDIEIADESGRKISLCRLTNMIIEKG